MVVNQYGLIDTGYAKKGTSSGTKLTVINSGNEVIVPVKSMVYTGGMNIDSMSVPGFVSSGSYVQAEVDTNSITNNVLTLSARYKRDNATQMTQMKNVFEMKNTKGVKILYYMSTTDGYETIPNLLGGTDSDHSSSGGYVSNTTPHLHCFVKSVTINEANGSQNGVITATIILQETG